MGSSDDKPDPTRRNWLITLHGIFYTVYQDMNEIECMKQLQAEMSNPAIPDRQSLYARSFIMTGKDMFCRKIVTCEIRKD